MSRSGSRNPDALRLRTGPFTFCVHRAPRATMAYLRRAYAEFLTRADEPFSDFHLALVPSRPAAAGFRNRVRLDIDGVGGADSFGPDLAYPYLEWGMNACVARCAHQYLLIHAATLERAGDAIVLTGTTGSGKSTLAAALMMRGWRLLSDEFALLKLDDGHLHAMARPINLKNESIDAIRRFEQTSGLDRTYQSGRKGTLAYLPASAESVACVDQPARPAWLIFVSYSAGATTDPEPIDGSRAMMRVIGHCFNYDRLGRIGFRALAGLIDRSICFTYAHGDLDRAVETLDGLAARKPVPATS